jgi:hypothetical protein
MKVLTTALLFVFALAFVSTDSAEAGRRRGGWNNKGWVKLGERKVNGRADRDSIAVGRRDGKFSKLTIAVEDDDLELLGLKVHFANGQDFDPQVKHYFRENDKTRVIDLPGDARVIQRIDLTYRNVGRGGRAVVQVWGFKTGGGRGR